MAMDASFWSGGLPACGRGGQLQRGELEVLGQPVLAELAADSGQPVAAERRPDVEPAPVDGHLAGAQLAGHRYRPFLVAGPHATREPVVRVVRDLHGLVVAVRG